MKKLMMKSALVMALFFSICLMPAGYANDGDYGTQNAPQQDMNPAGNVPPQKTWDQAWSGYFGRNLPDPLADPNMSPDEWNRQREQAGKRGQAAAEFTEAATSLVTAATPTPGGAAGAVAGATQQAITESAQAVVEAETTPTPERPGLLRRAWNWIKSWFD